MSLILANEALQKGLWYPTILGVLVVIAGVVLFCGSIYVLLGTNLGARLGFLVAFTGLAGFMVILTLLWCTTASPLNTLKGRIPQWKVQEVITNGDITKAKNETVHGIKQKQNVPDASEAANVKAAVDAALVTKVSTPTVEYTPNDNRYAEFADVTKYTILQTWEIGGSNPQFWKGEFSHTPQYAVVQFCQVEVVEQPFGLPPLPPQCDNSADAVSGYVVLFRDLGSLRFPAFVAFGMSLLLFLLGLLALHWREKDQMAAEEAKKAPAPVAVSDADDSELAKV